MVAINFSQQFVSSIASGNKRQTIRQSKRCKPGQQLQLYKGMRTKECRLIRNAICKDVRDISFSIDPLFFSPRIELNGDKLTHSEALDLAIDDGFGDATAMTVFFKGLYGMPFNGYLITWELNY